MRRRRRLCRRERLQDRRRRQGCRSASVSLTPTRCLIGKMRARGSSPWPLRPGRRTASRRRRPCHGPRARGDRMASSAPSASISRQRRARPARASSRTPGGRLTVDLLHPARLLQPAAHPHDVRPRHAVARPSSARPQTQAVSWYSRDADPLALQVLRPLDAVACARRSRCGGRRATTKAGTPT